jgi:hypothetical protein
MRFIPHDIGTFLVRSRSRDGHHIVDVIEGTCSCEGYQRNDTCAHLDDWRRRYTNLTMIIAMRARNPMTVPLT